MIYDVVGSSLLKVRLLDGRSECNILLRSTQRGLANIRTVEMIESWSGSSLFVISVSFTICLKPTVNENHLSISVTYNDVFDISVFYCSYPLISLSLYKVL